MKKSSKLIYNVAIVIILLLVIMFSFVLYQNAKNSESVSYRYTMNVLDVHASEKDIYVEWNKVQNWDTPGSSDMTKTQYEIIIHNNMNSSMYDWAMELVVPSSSRLDSGWNGDFSLNGNVLTINPVEYNHIIGPNTSIPLGMIITLPDTYEIKGFTLTMHKEYLITDSIYFWGILFLIIGLIVVVIISVVISIRLMSLKSKQKISLQITEQALDTFAYILDAKDEYTNGHSKRVAIYSHELARRMGLAVADQLRIQRIAMLHDIGKVNIPDEIIHKTSRLSDEEWQIIRNHPTIGATILKDFTSIPGIDVGAKYHHERYDGTGYPEGLKGWEIPLVARIISVADTYDAMASTRTYREGVASEEIIKELDASAGTQLDPEIVPHMIQMIYDGFAPLPDSEDNYL